MTTHAYVHAQEAALIGTHAYEHIPVHAQELQYMITHDNAIELNTYEQMHLTSDHNQNFQAFEKTCDHTKNFTCYMLQHMIKLKTYYVFVCD